MAGLKKYEKEPDVATKKLEKEMAELKKRDGLAKKLVVYEFKASEEYKKAEEGATSSYFGEGFINARSRLIFFFPISTSMIYRLTPILSTKVKMRRKTGKICKMPLFIDGLSHLMSPCIIYLFIYLFL